MVAPVLNGRLVGYARVSTDDQDLTLQIDSLTGLGKVKMTSSPRRPPEQKQIVQDWTLALPDCTKGTRSSFGDSIYSVARCTIWLRSLRNYEIAVSACHGYAGQMITRLACDDMSQRYYA